MLSPGKTGNGPAEANGIRHRRAPRRRKGAGPGTDSAPLARRAPITAQPADTVSKCRSDPGGPARSKVFSSAGGAPDEDLARRLKSRAQPSIANSVDEASGVQANRDRRSGRRPLGVGAKRPQWASVCLSTMPVQYVRRKR